MVEAERSRILPLYDAELTRPVAKRLAALGVEVLLGAKRQGADGQGWRARRRGGPDGEGTPACRPSGSW